MKNFKVITFCLLVSGCLSSTLFSQNYRLFIPGSDYLYRYNQNSYKGYRIVDALPIHLTDTIYHSSAESLMEGKLPCTKPVQFSWISPEIIKLADGTFILFNYHHDSIFIKPLAGLNDSWKFFSFKNGSYIRAKIAKADIDSFLGVKDSVKTIGFEYYDSLSNHKPYLTDHLYLKISKNYGMIHTLSFACFPDLLLNTRDMETMSLGSFDLAGISGKAGVQNPSKKVFFDFQPGDEIHTLYFTESYDYDSVKTRRIFLNRIDSYNEISYRVHDKIAHHYHLKKDTFYFVDTTGWVKYKLDDSIFNQLPSNQNAFIHASGWILIDTCFLTTDDSGKFIKSFPTHENFYDKAISDTCYHFVVADDCYGIDYYKEGLGGPYNNRVGCMDGWYTNKLLYYKKGNITWGTPLSIDSPCLVEKSKLKIYPNPWSSEGHITITSAEAYNLTIVDGMGKTISAYNGNSGDTEVVLNRKDFKPGIYFYRFNSLTGNISTGKFIVE